MTGAEIEPAKKYADYNTAPPLLNSILMILLLMRILPHLENIYIRTYGISSYKQFSPSNKAGINPELDPKLEAFNHSAAYHWIDYNQSCQ